MNKLGGQSSAWRFNSSTLRAAVFGFAVAFCIATPAIAQDVPAPNGSIPIPAPFINPNDPLAMPPAPANSQSGTVLPDEDQAIVSYDVDALPAPVREMRDLIIAAAKSGDLEKLRPLIGSGADITRLSLGETDGDPIDYIRSVSGDGEGHEMLAILQEIMEAGYVRLGAGTENELYVWPYFFALPLEGLSAPQRVELFKLVTAGDYNDMLEFGAYIFFRAGITPQGKWLFYLAGD